MRDNKTCITKEEPKKKIQSHCNETDEGKAEAITTRPKNKLLEEAGVKRVCAYCRVSTDDPKQTSSYELQKNHYEDMIKEHPGWELVGIFADEGISGTSLEHRESFNSMVAQCKEGKIDLIVTKSVSRFARNIVDCIRIVRELKSLTPPVGVFFEAEHIYTLEGTSEMILAVLSATAQEESRTKSEIMNISIEQRFSRGIFLLTNLLGFRRDEDGNLVINEDEADTVRLCFFLFLAGYSTTDIAAILTELRRPRMHGKTEWDNRTVLNILRNEKHCGDVLARKTFTPSYLDHKPRKNRQDKPQYREKDHHEAIVPREVFAAVGKMIDSHRYMRANCPLPLLQVIESGFLKGYVPVHLGWTGFGAEEYLQASGLFTQPEDDALSSRHPSSGFKIARTQMFSTVHSPALRISNSVFKFTASCMQKFGDVEYVEVLSHATAKKSPSVHAVPTIRPPCTGEIGKTAAGCPGANRPQPSLPPFLKSWDGTRSGFTASAAHITEKRTHSFLFLNSRRRNPITERRTPLPTKLRHQRMSFLFHRHGAKVSVQMRRRCGRWRKRKQFFMPTARESSKRQCSPPPEMTSRRSP